MQSIWQSSAMQQYHKQPVIHVADVPMDPDLSSWLSDETFLVHDSATWDMYALEGWIGFYTLHGMGARTLPEQCLNPLTACLEGPDLTPSHMRLAKSLWLGVWSNIPRIWLHPNFATASPRLQACVEAFIADPRLSIQWVRCNGSDLKQTLSWHDIV